MIPTTLCWYIFRDLLRVFLMTALALAGIMSFAGLLRPLTQHGLNGMQVAQMLGYFMPAMTTYSLPVAALFATTMVYGRFSADNELVAARAAGISHWMISLPALVLGLLVATVSLAMLAFLVPLATLQVERVIYSNLAQLVANQIDRTHTIDFNQDETALTIWAGSARVIDAPAGNDDQVVQLSNVMIATYERQGRGPNRIEVPTDFYIARSAMAYITPARGDEPVLLRVLLDQGAKFPRELTGRRDQAVEVSIAATQFGPWPLPSPVRENSKFMPTRPLQRLLPEPQESQRLGRLMTQFVREDMRQAYLNRLLLQLTESSDRVRFVAGDETYELIRGPAEPELVRDRLVIPSVPGHQQVRFRQIKADGSGLSGEAADVQVRAWPDLEDETMTVTVTLRGATVTIDGQPSPRGDGFERTFVVPMPPQVTAIKDRRVEDYLTGTNILPDQQRRLLRDKLKQHNSIMSEIQSRLSFSLSCLVLVLVGACLGMMFRAGNFLSAFAVSVVPALLSIVLIVSGQHTAENIPWNIDRNFTDPLKLGLTLIWTGNATVALLAMGLMWRLARK